MELRLARRPASADAAPTAVFAPVPKLRVGALLCAAIAKRIGCHDRPTIGDRLAFDAPHAVCLAPLTRARADNEIILDPAPYTRMLPHAIEAVFYAAAATEEQRGHARRVRAAFAVRFGLKQVPLLVYEPNNRKKPFAVV